MRLEQELINEVLTLQFNSIDKLRFRFTTLLSIFIDVMLLLTISLYQENLGHLWTHLSPSGQRSCTM
jgi:hypothetical protein